MIAANSLAAQAGVRVWCRWRPGPLHLQPVQSPDIAIGLGAAAVGFLIGHLFHTAGA